MPEIRALMEQIERKRNPLSSLDIKECRKEAIVSLIDFELWELESELWHEIKPWENIWRIIYNHALEYGKNPIKPDRLESIKISPGDKVYFTKDYVYVKNLKWWYYLVSFDENNCTNTKNIPQSRTSPHTQIINQKEIPSSSPRQDNGKTPVKEISFSTIFDKDSPLLWDKIAYKNEIKIRKLYWKIVTYLIDIYCQWSLIDESFLYGMIARESRFDKNARSPTGVKGLGQITSDTIETIININIAKTRNNPAAWDLYISDILRGANGKTDRNKVLEPLNQIKLTISYLLYLESLFSHIENEEFKKKLIITSYNLWPWKTQEVLSKYNHIQDWKWLKKSLQQEVVSGKISNWKLNEINNYVPAVMENIRLAQQ